jgi:hypothetical protein
MNPWEKYAGQQAEGGPWEKYSPMSGPEAFQRTYMAGAAYAPTFLQNALITTGMAMSDPLTGGPQRANELASKIPGEFFAPLRETSARRAAEIEAQVTADREARNAALNRPGGGLGYVAGATPLIAATSMVPGANTIPGAAIQGGIFGGLQPTGEGESAAANTVRGAILNSIAQGTVNILQKIGQGWSASTAQKAADEASRNAVRDQIVQKARQEGISLPAAVTNPGSKIAGVVEGLAGQNTTAARMASRNQPRIDAMARRVLGASETEPLTQSLVDRAVQREYVRGYLPVKRAGQINADMEFANARAAIEAPYTEMQAGFPASSQMPSGLRNLLDDLSASKWDAKTIVGKVRELRFDAKKNLQSMDDPDKARLGMAQKQVANELENLIERNLSRQGRQGVLDQFKASRRKMAQAFDVGEAMTPAGNINAEVLGKKAVAGEPLTDELKTIGDAWSLHRKGSMGINPMSLGQRQPLLTPFDLQTAGAALGGGLTGAALGHPEALLTALLPLARPALRALSTTGPYQRAIGTPNYGPGMLPRAAQGLLDNEIMPALLKGAGIFGALTSE